MLRKENNSKILFIDLETAPNLGWVWGKWKQDVIEFDKYTYMLSFAAKWLGEKKITIKSLPQFTKFYKQDKEDDEYLVKELWNLFNEADVIIAHNGDAFDIKVANTRFAYHELSPPVPYKTVDTKKIAKKYFRFPGNSLNELGKYLNLGEKLGTGGFSTWKGCMSGDKKAWKKMEKYNIQDVKLLEEIYIRLRPWANNHPNIGMFFDNLVCPKCGSSHLQSRGIAINKTTQYRRFQCQNCGGWGRTVNNIRENKPIVNV